MKVWLLLGALATVGVVVWIARTSVTGSYTIRTAQLDDGTWVYETWRHDSPSDQTSVDHGGGFDTEALALAAAKARTPGAA